MATLSLEVQEGKITPLVDLLEATVAALKLQPGYKETPPTGTTHKPDPSYPKKQYKEEKAEFPIKLVKVGDGDEPASKAQCGAAYAVLKDRGFEAKDMANAIARVTDGEKVKDTYALTVYTKASVSKLITGLKQFDFDAPEPF